MFSMLYTYMTCHGRSSLSGKPNHTVDYGGFVSSNLEGSVIKFGPKVNCARQVDF